MSFFFFLSFSLSTRTRKRVCTSQGFPPSYPASLFPLSSYLFRWCCVYAPPEPSMLSSATQPALLARRKKQNFWHLIFRCAHLFDESDECEMLSKQVVPSNQLASQHLKQRRLLTKQSHTPVGNGVPWGRTYTKTSIIIPLHAMPAPSSRFLSAALGCGVRLRKVSIKSACELLPSGLLLLRVCVDAYELVCVWREDGHDMWYFIPAL